MISASPHCGVQVKRDPVALGVIAPVQGDSWDGSLLPVQLLLRTISPTAESI
jgi:hypothetical protein